MAAPAWQPTPAVAPSRKTSPIVFVLVAVLVVALGVGGFFAYKEFFAPAATGQPPAPEQQAAAVQPGEAAPGGAGEQALGGPPAAPDFQPPAQVQAPARGDSSMGGSTRGARTSTPPPDSASSAPAAELPPSAASAPAAVPASEPPPAAAPVQEQKRVEILKPETSVQSQSPPAATPVKPAYSGPPAGVVLWSGRLEKDGSVTIDGNSASFGNLTGELPGVPVMIEVDQREFALAETPSSSNGWKRITIRSRTKRHSVVSITWSILK
jgi:hypothetical protein